MHENAEPLPNRSTGQAPQNADFPRLQLIYEEILRNPTPPCCAKSVASKFGLTNSDARRDLDYLAAIEREYEDTPRFRGIAKILHDDRAPTYEPLSDNPDVRRDYDYRATNAGGRDLCPKNMFYYVWAWINICEKRCEAENIPNGRRILITNDCRYYPEETLHAARTAAKLRGYEVILAVTAGGAPSCVSSYSHAVRLVRPVLAIFITASHVSRPVQNMVIGAKVSVLGSTGRLESLTTKDIKTTTAVELDSLKRRDDLARLLAAVPGEEKTVDVTESHTKLAVAAALASLGELPQTSFFDIAQVLKVAPDLDQAIAAVIPKTIPPLFKGLRVVVDGAFTSSGPLAYEAFQRLGASTTLLHEKVQTVKGPHHADPSITKNLQLLFKKMAEQKAHMGMAFDLDGDRGAIVLPQPDGGFTVLAPDRLGQVLMPFLMDHGGYRQAAKPMFIRDCLSTDALLEQGVESGVAIETTDAGYVFLKKREIGKAQEGFLVMGMGEASGHVWLDYTGPFENPIVLAVLFVAMGVATRRASGTPDGSPEEIPAGFLESVFTKSAIPFRKSARFQPLFAPELIASAAVDPRNDTGWSPEVHAPIPQKIITLCRDASVRKMAAYFTTGRQFPTPLGTLAVEQFESQWDEEEGIFRFGKIHFSLDGHPVGSFVTRGSSNDPTAVQVWEVREFQGPWSLDNRLPEAVVEQRFHLLGGLVLTTCRKLGILELVDRPPAANMAEILVSVAWFESLLAERPQTP